ncbi:uncharacterized protein LOC125674988 isoform X3 [Ostrea edulis]|uniref:uncharacterized protein LOC125674988 isoform X3 n=1 Tax=Ostrea edulis TaxID=37623 RepID=UPI0024AF9826|nr:uncharacterized protein LOC125674988 isoform X3 [Ostrea edulis]
MEVNLHVFPFLLLLLMLHCVGSNNHFERVMLCPKSGEEWQNRAQEKKCQNQTPDFMCAAIEDQPGKFGEICTIVGMSNAGKCAVLDADTYNLNYVRCSAPTGCPSKVYIASDVYKYKACYENIYSVESTTIPNISKPEQQIKENTTNHSYQAVGSQDVFAIAIISVFIFVFVITIAFTVWRNKFQRIRKLPDSAEDPRSLLHECQDELKGLPLSTTENPLSGHEVPTLLKYCSSNHHCHCIQGVPMCHNSHCVCLFSVHYGIDGDSGNQSVTESLPETVSKEDDNESA